MPKYGITYRLVSDFYVEVETDTYEDAESMLLDSANPVNDIGGKEPHFLSSDIDYDDYIIEVLTK